MARPSAPRLLGLLGLSASLLALSAKAWTSEIGPIHDYLNEMCYPLYSEATRDPTVGIYLNSLSQSPFPCEQTWYLETVCNANGTTPIDFAAEQQCLCGGNYFAASAGCADCFAAHGSPDNLRADWVSRISSLSTAECGPATPTQPFSNLFSPATWMYEEATATSDAAYISSADGLRSQTAVSGYYTGGALPTPGSITGDATGRLTSFTNWGYATFTPTGAKSTSTTAGTSAVTTSVGGDEQKTQEAAGDAASTTASTAAAAQRTAAGGLAAVVLGVAMML